MRLLTRAVAVALLATAAALGSAGTPPGTAGRVTERPRLAASSALTPAPGYYVPVVTGGKVFPVARSNFLSLIEFPNSWHAPRLRLINGKWLLVGVHEGIDITAERGTPILSMTPGVVENVGWTFYSGLRVGVRGSDGRYYFYAHLTDVEQGIAVGVPVGAGTVLGRVGNTGYGPVGHRDEFPPHLHLGIEVGAQWVNPYPTLVSLYAAMVRTTEQWQARLDDLAAAGKRSSWQRQAAQTYMRLSPPLGE